MAFPYNIEDVSGNLSGGISDWTATLDLSDPGVTSVSGDFDEVPLDGGPQQEAPDGYFFEIDGDLDGDDTVEWGTLTWNDVNGIWDFAVNRSAVIASGQDQTVVINVIGYDGEDFDDDTVTITILICVARGTLIDTPKGSIPVENLVVGDRIKTLDGPAQPVRWIGSRKIGAPELSIQPELRPIRISPGALGDHSPKRDLIVSPQHRVLVSGWQAELHFGEEEVLVPAKALLNDNSILIDHGTREVKYFHLLFDQHEIMFTEGAPTESFYPGSYSLNALETSARDELLTLFPELSCDEDYGGAARPAVRPAEAAILAEAMA